MSLFGLIQQGDLVGAIKKVVALFQQEEKALELEFPIIGQFIQQFADDFGKACLKEAQAIFPGVIADPSTFATAAEGMVEKIIEDGIQIARDDGRILAMNALRLYVSAPQTPAA